MTRRSAVWAGLLVLGACPRGEPPEPCAEVWVRWENFAQPQVQTWCTPCHSADLAPDGRQGAPVGVDFDTLAGAQAHSQRIAARTADATMPPAGGLTDEERALLSLWATCGAPGEEGEPPAADPCEPAAPWGGDGSPCAAGANTITGDLVVGTALDLSCVCRVDGDLAVEGDADLPRLREVGGDVRVEGAALSLDAPELSAIGGTLSVSAAEVSRVALPALQTVGGAIRVAANPRLVSLILDRIDAVGGDFEVTGNPSLVDWRGMQSPRTVGGSIRVIDNDALLALDAFGRLASLGGDVVLDDNDNVVELFGFQKLLVVPGRVQIADNDRMVLIETLVDVVSVGGGLSIASNPELVEISGFAFLETIGEADGGGLRIADHPHLVSVPGFVRLARTGGVDFEANGALVTLAGGFEALSDADGPVRFVGNPALVVFGLPALRTVPALTLSGTASLSRVSGLEALTEVEGDLVLESNTALTGVTGLYGVDRVGGTLRIRDNPALSQAAIDAWLAEIPVVGATEIAGNGP